MKSVLTFTLLCIASASLLALANVHTNSYIQQNIEKQELARLEGLVDELDRELLCEQGIELFEVERRGYGGEMYVVVAIQDGSVLGVRVVRHSETPGFDEVLSPDDWIGRFAVEELEGIDAVTRATVTTSAVLLAVEDAMRLYESGLGECIETP
ncbi:MAG: FMN-binding protein [Gammaproteobacteria bacterium]|nr:FMN-binding protein [Gammaproteobacteria bacterium]